MFQKAQEFMFQKAQILTMIIPLAFRYFLLVLRMIIPFLGFQYFLLVLTTKKCNFVFFQKLK